MTGLRHTVAPLLGAAALLAGLAACSSTLSGDPTYVGAGPTTTTQTTQPTTEETTVTTEPTTDPSSPSLTVEESTACLLIPLSDVDAFDQFNAVADKGDAGTQADRDAVAASFDIAATEVQTYVDPLPAGPIRDAAQGYHDSQIAVRDGLTSGSDVTTQTILDQQTILQGVCGTG